MILLFEKGWLTSEKADLVNLFSFQQSSVFLSVFHEKADRLKAQEPDKSSLDVANALLELSCFRSTKETEILANPSAIRPGCVAEPGDSADEPRPSPTLSTHHEERQSKRTRRGTDFFDPTFPATTVSSDSSKTAKVPRSFSVGDMVRTLVRDA